MQKAKRKRLSCDYRQCGSTVLVSCFMSMRCTGFIRLKQEMLKRAALEAFLCFLRAQSFCVNLAALSYDSWI